MELLLQERQVVWSWKNPNWRRVYSLAVTAEPNTLGGQPSSWSAEIDNLVLVLEDDIRSIYFIISAGNSQPIKF